MFLSVAVTYTTSTVSRSIWTKERRFTIRIVHCSFTVDWPKPFRMSKETFLYLCQELRHTISRYDTQMRKTLPCKMWVAITLWQLRTNDSYRTVGHLFGVSCSSVCLIVKEVCQAIVKKLLPIYIRIPAGDTLKRWWDSFKANIVFHKAWVLLMVLTFQL